MVDTERRKEIVAKNHEVLSRQWESTKAELSDQVHLYKKSFENMKETLSGDLNYWSMDDLSF